MKLNSRYIVFELFSQCATNYFGISVAVKPLHSLPKHTDNNLTDISAIKVENEL